MPVVLSVVFLGAFQGHGNVAHPHGILITWATIMEGGIQVNAEGRRFWDETQGYSEAAAAVLAQPNAIAWAVFDARIAGIARQFADNRSHPDRIGGPAKAIAVIGHSCKIIEV